MKRRDFMQMAGLSALALGRPSRGRAKSADIERANVIYIMLDEWGYYEMSGLGHQKLKTPNIDQFMREGMRFTQCLAGAPVCGPTRASLLTGKHSGHTSMRINTATAPIKADEFTLGDLFKSQGYATGGFGKWGIGGVGTPGVPEKHGFDEFFGYYSQKHAHSYFPDYLIRNSRKVPLEGNSGERYEGEQFSHDLIWENALEFIGENIDSGRRFFCYLPLTIPHGHWGFDKSDPAWDEFKDKPWTAGQSRATDARVYAAMMLMFDRQLGELIEMLEAGGVDENTVIFLCGDNGGQDYFYRDKVKKGKRYHRGFFAPNVNPKTGVEFRGQKRDLYEGGLRVPYLVRWPGRIEAGTTTDHLCYAPDLMPTLADLAGARVPAEVATDGISFAPTLLGRPAEQKQHEYLYWEYQGGRAVRRGKWKAVKNRKNKPWELYNLEADISETEDLSDSKPEILAELKGYAEDAHISVEQVRGTG